LADKRTNTPTSVCDIDNAILINLSSKRKN